MTDIHIKNVRATMVDLKIFCDEFSSRRHYRPSMQHETLDNHDFIFPDVNLNTNRNKYLEKLHSSINNERNRMKRIDEVFDRSKKEHENLLKKIELRNMDKFTRIKNEMAIALINRKRIMKSRYILRRFVKYLKNSRDIGKLKEKKMTIILQSITRYIFRRKYLKFYRQVVKCQSIIRGFLVRKKLQGKRRAARLIAVALGKRRRYRDRRIRIKAALRKTKAIIKLQCFVRKIRAIKKLKIMKRVKIENIAAAIIQRNYIKRCSAVIDMYIN